MDSVAEALSKTISDSLKRNEDRLTIGVYRPSLLPACLRRQFLAYRRGFPPPGEEKAGVFKIGELFHGFLSETLRRSEPRIRVKGSESGFSILLPVPDSECKDFIQIVGRADLIVKLGGGDGNGDGGGEHTYIIEAKSIKRLPEAPLRHHVWQLQLYLAGHRLSRGFLVYLEKQALRHRIFAVDFDREAFRRLLERALILHKALVEDKPPKPDPEAWECRFCEFLGECYYGKGKEGEGREPEGEGEVSEGKGS
ncbi:MAG: PD-(D/E)XK nuclease family protein [Candidatus Bathyarchaeia archaeon]